MISNDDEYEYEEQSKRNSRSSNGNNKIFGNYQLIKTIGEGEFGKVKLGINIETQSAVAVKLIKKKSVYNQNKLTKLCQEISILEKVNHPYIIKTYEVIENDEYIGIIMEYASGGELFEYILDHRYLEEEESKTFFAQLLSGINYLHKNHLVHRDLKLENLLLDAIHNIVITDFGFATESRKDEHKLLNTSCGSPCYAAPELVINDGYVGESADIWSCGVILYAMLCGYLPFDDDPNNPDGENIHLLYRYILETEVTFPDYISEEAKDLLRGILNPDPETRFTMERILDHPWIRDFKEFILLEYDENNEAIIPNYMDYENEEMQKDEEINKSENNTNMKTLASQIFSSTEENEKEKTATTTTNENAFYPNPNSNNKNQILPDISTIDSDQYIDFIKQSDCDTISYSNVPPFHDSSDQLRPVLPSSQNYNTSSYNYNDSFTIPDSLSNYFTDNSAEVSEKRSLVESKKLGGDHSSLQESIKPQENTTTNNNRTLASEDTNVENRLDEKAEIILPTTTSTSSSLDKQNDSEKQANEGSSDKSSSLIDQSNKTVTDSNEHKIIQSTLYTDDSDNNQNNNVNTSSSLEDEKKEEEINNEDNSMIIETINLEDIKMEMMKNNSMKMENDSDDEAMNINQSIEKQEIRRDNLDIEKMISSESKSVIQMDDKTNPNPTFEISASSIPQIQMSSFDEEDPNNSSFFSSAIDENSYDNNKKVGTSIYSSALEESIRKNSNIGFTSLTNTDEFNQSRNMDQEGKKKELQDSSMMTATSSISASATPIVIAGKVEENTSMTSTPILVEKIKENNTVQKEKEKESSIGIKKEHESQIKEDEQESKNRKDNESKKNRCSKSSKNIDIDNMKVSNIKITRSNISLSARRRLSVSTLSTMNTLRNGNINNSYISLGNESTQPPLPPPPFKHYSYDITANNNNNNNNNNSKSKLNSKYTSSIYHNQAPQMQYLDQQSLRRKASSRSYLSHISRLSHVTSQYDVHSSTASITNNNNNNNNNTNNNNITYNNYFGINDNFLSANDSYLGIHPYIYSSNESALLDNSVLMNSFKPTPKPRRESIYANVYKTEDSRQILTKGQDNHHHYHHHNDKNSNTNNILLDLFNDDEDDEKSLDKDLLTKKKEKEEEEEQDKETESTTSASSSTSSLNHHQGQPQELEMKKISPKTETENEKATHVFTYTNKTVSVTPSGKELKLPQNPCIKYFNDIIDTRAITVSPPFVVFLELQRELINMDIDIKVLNNCFKIRCQKKYKSMDLSQIDLSVLPEQKKADKVEEKNEEMGKEKKEQKEMKINHEWLLNKALPSIQEYKKENKVKEKEIKMENEKEKEVKTMISNKENGSKEGNELITELDHPSDPISPSTTPNIGSPSCLPSTPKTTATITTINTSSSLNTNSPSPPTKVHRRSSSKISVKCHSFRSCTSNNSTASKKLKSFVNSILECTSTTPKSLSNTPDSNNEKGNHDSNNNGIIGRTLSFSQKTRRHFSLSRNKSKNKAINIEFTVEICRIKNRDELYILKFKKQKGDSSIYKDIYNHILNRLHLNE